MDRAVLKLIDERGQNSVTASEGIFYIMLIPVASIPVAHRIAASVRVSKLVGKVDILF